MSRLASRLPVTEKILWSLFWANTLTVISSLVGWVHGHTLNIIITYLPLILVAIHGYWTLGVKRGLSFIALASLIGFTAEAISLNYGTLFGGTYTYSSNMGLTVAKVPLSIITYWAIFIYIGYWLVTTASYWLNKKKPVKEHESLSMVALLAVADGLVVTAIDLLMDPVSIRSGSWKWTGGGLYYGVPIGNFVGWFLVTTIVTGIFRTFEYYRPVKFKRNHSILLLPVLGYLLVSLDFLVGAASYHLKSLVILGIVVILAFPLVNLALYHRTR